MEQFVLIFRNTLSNLAQTQRKPEVQKQWDDWLKDLATNGALANGVRPMSEGAVVNVAGTHNQPFLDGGYVFSGMIVVRTGTIGEAIEIAKRCPIIQAGGNVEVRGVMS